MNLKPVADTDLDLILPWRNAPPLRRAMYTHHEIGVAEHRAWFQCLRDDPRRRWYLYFDDAGTELGVVYFTDLDPVQGTAFWGFYARPEAPRDIGLEMELAALELASGELALHKRGCEVLANNGPVVNMHKKVSFAEEGCFREQHYDGANRLDVVRLRLLASEWHSHQDNLRARVAGLREPTAMSS